MSYLLKALEKAEQERQQNINTEQGELVVIQQTSSLPIGLVFMVVVILLLTLWQVWPNKNQDDLLGAQEVITPSIEKVIKQEVAYIEIQDQAKAKTTPTQIAHVNVVEKPVAEQVIAQEVAVVKPKDLSELTTEELKRIPSLNLASHIYSSAAEFRSVVINDQTYKEGSLIQAGLKLETINQNGIVINIHGQRVELPKGISWVASQNAK